MEARDPAALAAERPNHRDDGHDEVSTGRCLVVVPVLPDRFDGSQAGVFTSLSLRSEEARVEEAAGLARAIDLDVIKAFPVRVASPKPGTLLGRGKIDDIGVLVTTEAIDLVVMDAQLSPVQQRNLERTWGAKVLDRTGLILEIFGRRARTKEGVLQVELAHLTYQKSRLVRSWTHLERQRGGVGFLGGPGETQIEADRRMLQERVNRIEKELEQVRATRSLHRRGRQRVPLPVVALVGYTNAGKSTLFNRLTGADVVARDLLFATLDPTLRTVSLPHGRDVILSDTVGFISDLPTHLIAAFRATLEEVREAELILHVRDMSAASADAEAADVAQVLHALDIDMEAAPERMIEVWNKCDVLSDERRILLAERIERMTETERPVMVSAITGEGMETLLETLEQRMSRASVCRSLVLGPDDGASLAWLYRHCDVLDREDNPETGAVTLKLRVASSRADDFTQRFPTAESLQSS